MESSATAEGMVRVKRKRTTICSCTSLLLGCAILCYAVSCRAVPCRVCTRRVDSDAVWGDIWALSSNGRAPASHAGSRRNRYPPVSTSYSDKRVRFSRIHNRAFTNYIDFFLFAGSFSSFIRKRLYRTLPSSGLLRNTQLAVATNWSESTLSSQLVKTTENTPW